MVGDLEIRLVNLPFFLPYSSSYNKETFQIFSISLLSVFTVSPLPPFAPIPICRFISSKDINLVLLFWLFFLPPLYVLFKKKTVVLHVVN